MQEKLKSKLPFAASILVIFAIFWAACSSSEDKPTASVDAKPAVEQPAKPVETTKTEPAPQKVAAETPAPTPHNYDVEDNGVYGYTQTLSEDDKKSGTASKPMVMVRYLGQKNGRYSVAFSVSDDFNGIVNYASCAGPCEYIKVSVAMQGQTMHTEMMPAGHTLAAAVMEDAMAGNLKPYRKQKGL